MRFFLLVSVFLVACDPGRRLLVRAGDQPGAFVSVYGNSLILPHPDTNYIRPVVIKLPREVTGERDTMFHYGLGTWSTDEWMIAFSRNIDSIIISNSNGKLILDDSQEINSYLLKHRSGFGKSILTIGPD